MSHDAAMRHVASLGELVRLVQDEPCEPGQELYARWSRGPDADLAPDDRNGPAGQSSRDGLSGVPLPGLSANPLRPEPWWGDRSLRLWLARRLIDYRHLERQRGPGTRPWVLAGQECGRGPDNEPLVVCCRPVAWIDPSVLDECETTLAEHGAEDWGPLDRHG